jgi:hypothetical protein
MSETQWVTLKPSNFSMKRDANARGVKGTVSLSPFDVPYAIGSSFDPETHFFTILFDYLDSEEPRTKCKVADSVMELGANSRRVYSIRIVSPESKEGALRRKEIEKVLVRAFQTLETKAPSNRKRADTYRAARTAFGRNSGQLLAADTAR